MAMLNSNKGLQPLRSPIFDRQRIWLIASALLVTLGAGNVSPYKIFIDKPKTQILALTRHRQSMLALLSLAQTWYNTVAMQGRDSEDKNCIACLDSSSGRPLLYTRCSSGQMAWKKGHKTLEDVEMRKCWCTSQAMMEIG